MKRCCILLLSLVFLWAAALPALATEMYDTYGDMDNWDEATWEFSESWSDEQWQDYWLGEEEVYLLQREAERRAQRQALNLPNLDGVNVKLNDSYLTFENAWPVLVDSSVHLPLRDFLAACGVEAEISFSAETGIAHTVLADGRELIAALGSQEVTVIDEEGRESISYTYEPPLLIDGRFYMQQWDLCAFLGLDTRWDYYSEILYIIDSEALIARIDEDFSIYNHLFSVSGLKMEAGQAYQLKGGIAFNAVLYGDEKDDKVQAVLEYSGLMQDKNADISLGLKLDFQEIKDTLLYGVDDDDMLLLQAISAGQGRLIINSAEQAAYLQSNLLPLADTRLSSKDWLQLDYRDMAPMGLATLGSGIMEELAGMSIGRLIYESAGNSYYYSGSRDDYANAINQAMLWQALIGDDNFRQESRGGYTVYTLKADQSKLKKFAEDSDIQWFGGDILGALFGPYRFFSGEEPSTFSHSLTFREKSGQVTDFQMKAAAQTKGFLPVSYSATIEYAENNITAHFAMDGRYGAKMSLDFSWLLTPVKDAPAEAPPAGSRVVPVHELDSQRLLWF